MLELTSVQSFDCLTVHLSIDVNLSCIQVGVDLIGPLPVTAHGKRYIVTMIDYFTKWPEADSLFCKSAVAVAQFIFRTICRYIIAMPIINLNSFYYSATNICSSSK